MYMVGEAGHEGEKEKEIGEVKNEGNPWVVAGIMEKSKLVGARGRKPMTLEAWMPRNLELNNRYKIFQVEEETKEPETIGTIKAEEESGVVRVTVDSDAAKKRVAAKQKRSPEKKNGEQAKAGGGEWDEN